jgi:hypothetical protein
MCTAATLSGTVTNKTSGRPSSGDSVALVDVQAGMADAASASTDAQGRYSLQTPGAGPYLVRVTHQGASYFIAAPQGGAPGDVTVYDVASKVEGVGIDADMLLVEADAGTLRVQERYLIRNTSQPPRAQYSNNTFEVVIPAEAELDGASATRPGGLGTTTHLTPLSTKGHFSFTVPIQPDQGEKETMFEVQYHLPYKGKFAFSPQVTMPADNLVLYLPKSMTFSAGSGASFQPSQENPMLQTFIQKNVRPGQRIGFAVEGEGQVQREQQSGMQGGIGQGAAMGATPGGGIGTPIGTPDPLTKYKGWILGALALGLAGTAAFLLRRRSLAVAGADMSQTLQPSAHTESFAPEVPTTRGAKVKTPGAERNTALLNILKDELFAIESEKIAGTLPLEEYTQIKAGLEAVLRRAMRRN